VLERVLEQLVGRDRDPADGVRVGQERLVQRLDEASRGGERGDRRTEADLQGRGLGGEVDVQFASLLLSRNGPRCVPVQWARAPLCRITTTLMSSLVTSAHAWTAETIASRIAWADPRAATSRTTSPSRSRPNCARLFIASVTPSV